MASYTIEDIELIRRKSGISYQEAVALLDYHNGNVARALVDLERNGRMKPEGEPARARESHEGTRGSRGGLMGFLTRLYQFRLKVRKGPVLVLNVSLLFTLLTLLISPHLVIIGAILMLILGYHVSFDKRDPDFASENLERMVRNAGENVRETVGDFARGFESAFSDSAANRTAEPKQQPAQPDRSYYASNPAATTTHQAYDPADKVPTIQVPVQVESQDGSVQIDSDKDGYNSATVK